MSIERLDRWWRPRRRLGALVVATITTASSAAHADEEPEPEPGSAPAPAEPASNIDVRASAEVSGYLDSVATTVLTPSIAGVVANPAAGWSLNGRYLVDVVSAASPDIVSTASPPFEEVRHAGNLGLRYKPGRFGVAADAFVSSSPDYLSGAGGIVLSEDLDDKNYTLTEGYHFGHDVIGRTGTSFSVFSRQLDTHSFTLGASTVANPSLLVGLTADVVLERGDPSKPYRYVPVFSPSIAPLVPAGATVDFVAATRLQARPLEQLPLERARFALTSHTAWRLSGWMTLRFDERGYADSWSQLASTTDGRLFFDLGRRVILWPHLRAHVQNGVSFWQRAYIATGSDHLPALRTGDRELSPLFNLGTGAGLRVALGKSGRVEDLTWTTTMDGTWTRFADAIYVTHRWSAILTTGMELTF